MWDIWNFSFFGRGDFSPTHSELCCFVLGSQAKHQVSYPAIILLKNFLSASAIALMSWQKVIQWLNLPFAHVSGSVEHNVHSTFSFPNPLSESKELQAWRCLKILLSFLVRFDGYFWPNQRQQQCLPQFESILHSHLSHHLLPAPFHLKIENTTLKRLISSDLHSHKPFAPILVFQSQIDWLWNKNLWQLYVHFHRPWHIKKTDFTWQVITRTLSNINKRNSVCKLMLVDCI